MCNIAKINSIREKGGIVKVSDGILNIQRRENVFNITLRSTNPLVSTFQIVVDAQSGKIHQKIKIDSGVWILNGKFFDSILQKDKNKAKIECYIERMNYYLAQASK
ncbi:hypothetical protein C0583_01895 [Candidatus Parcubacteria bacterium]|mgnify:CR=1 FL=1|nr:MAG: hypothetical protein C0583_01895 [Candidatus Parcubacteria bacterium]